MRRVAARLRTALRIAAVLLLSAALLEGLLVAVRRLPALAAVPGLTAIGRQLYMLDRAYLQMQPGAMRWDPGLGYTLAPGEFRFRSTEFDTRYRVNSAGLRDTETALDRPQVIVLGDSFAMGWGVEQAEAFPQQLARLTGRRVLNAGIASYGTARELRLLARLDTSATEWVVLQFCNNDFFENRRFVEEGDAFHTATRQQYQAAIDDYRRSSRYWPGRYAVTLLGRALGLAGEPPGPDPDDPAAQQLQVETFLAVLQGSPVDLSRFRLVVFELNGHNLHHDFFAPLLRAAIAEPGRPAWLRRMVVLDLASQLPPADWYTLDDHLRPAGHRLIAQHLADLIGPASATDR